LSVKVLIALATLLAFRPALAQTANVRMAPSNFFSLPMELEADSGADNGDALVYRAMPLYSFSINEDWRLVNLDLVTLADAPGGVPGRPGNPEPLPGDQVFGLGDLVHTSFLTPERQTDYIWGAGLMLAIPTATDGRLGSGKWAIGPAVRLAYRTGSWNIGAVAGNRWSFAGDADRAEVNQLMVRGLVRRKLPNDWFFVSAPIITANWNAPSGERWLLPLGGGFGRVFNINSRPWSWSIQGYYNVIRPDMAPEYAVRVAMVAALPYGGNRAVDSKQIVCAKCEREMPNRVR